MKTIYTLSAIVLIALSLSSKADDKIKNRVKTSGVSVAPFVWGDLETEAPHDLGNLKAKNALIPVAPFVWGSPEDAASISELPHLLVPVAPFYFGEPEADAPAGLEFIKAKNARVPIAPFEYGNPDSDAPTNIDLLVGR